MDMPRQDKMLFAPNVPIAWLRDYAAMLKVAMAVEIKDPLFRDAAKGLDAKIKIRLDEIEAYLSKLEAPRQQVN